jgi:hypothetical protein
MMTRDHIPDRIGVYDEHGRPVLDERTGEQRVRMFDTSFASENWNKAIRDRGHPGMFVRRHLEACVLTYLADELRTGDIAVTGAATYANWAGQLLTPAEVAERLPAFCAGVGIPGAAAGFRTDLQTRLGTQCRAADAAYPDLADFAIDDAGRPSLKQYRAAPPTASRASPGSGAAGPDARTDPDGHPGPDRALAGVVAPVLPVVGLGSEAEGPVRALHPDHVHVRHQPRPGAGRPAYRRCHRPRAVDHVGPARHDRQAEQGDRRHRGRVHRAGPDQGLG